jgi:pentatricopeptide repeat protein
VLSFHSVAGPLAEHGAVRDVEAIINEMLRRNLLPNDFTLSALLKAHVARDGFEQAITALPSMLASLRAHAPALRPGIVTYLLQLNEWARRDNIAEVDATWTAMRADGVAPSPRAFEIALDAYQRAGATHKMDELVKEMRAAGIQPPDSVATVLSQRLDDDDD